MFKSFVGKLGQVGFLVLLLSILPVVSAGQIIGSEKLFGRYRQFVWQDQHGLPQNGISAIVKTPDGYLWLAIAEGVARFDGVRFTAFDTSNTPQIKSNNVQSLLVDRQGTLWIGTHGGGITSYRDGIFENYSTEEGLSDSHVTRLFEDNAGNIWAGTDGGGLNCLRDGKFTVYSASDGLSDNRITSITENKSGTLFVGTEAGLVRYVNGQFIAFSVNDGLRKGPIGCLFVDLDDELWVGGPEGLMRFRDGYFAGVDEPNRPTEAVHTMSQDTAGTIWFGTLGGGVYRLKDGKFDSCSTKTGLINDRIQALYADSSGDIWLGTNGGGLAQLKTGRFNVLTKADGLPGEMIGAVFEDSGGDVWIGTDEGMCRFRDDKITVMTANGQPIKGVLDISQDRDGNLWVSSDSGNMVLRPPPKGSTVEIVRDDVFESRAAVTLPDRNGNVWYGTSHDGLHLVKPDGSTTVFHRNDGLADEYVNVLYEARDGMIWIGTRRGLSQFRDGGLKTWAAADGFTASHVLSFREDGAGDLWIGTHGDGLFRFRDNKFAAFTSKNGLYDNLAFSIVEDGNGNLWMSGNKGIYRASITEMDDFSAGRRPSIDSFSYGNTDGMLSRECNGANPSGIRAKDGKLWFPTIKGVVVVDPNPQTSVPPNVAIEQVSSDDKIFQNDKRIEMQPGEQNLEIQFTALSWGRPEQIRFRYQLAGLDAEWVDAGTRRTAYFPHIPPGDYTFRVIADNGEGVWNEQSQNLGIVVLPAFYQSWWFFALCVLTAALIVRLFYLYRLSQMEKINRVRTAFTQQLIANQESERERIALELHDSIGQNLIVIRNRALMSLAAPEKQEKIIEQLREISGAAADSIKEVREIAHNLHPYQLEHLGLTTALETMIESVDEATEMEFDSRIDDVDDTLAKDSEINFYRIVQEALNNIAKHSDARTVEISVQRNNGFLNLSIADDGKGFDIEAIKDKRGLGLTGLRERAKMLGADIEISSHRGKGTVINLQMNIRPHE